MKTPPSVSPQRLAANRANAAKSTGPRTPQGKARSAQNARKYHFNPEYYAVLRIESPESLADLVADAVARYQPVDAQELHAVERIALAQQSILRGQAWEAGFFTSCLDEAMEIPGIPCILRKSDLTRDLDVTPGQNRSFWLANGISQKLAKNNGLEFTLFLRYQALVERQYRRAIEEFDRLKALRHELPSDPLDDLQNEPIACPQQVGTKEEAEPASKPQAGANPVESNATLPHDASIHRIPAALSGKSTQRK